MGLTFSCPGGSFDSLDESLDALLKSLTLGNDYIKSNLRSVSFNGHTSEPALKAWGSGKLLIKRPLSFNKRDKDPLIAENKFSSSRPASQKSVNHRNTRFAPSPIRINIPDSPKHEAAIKLQKVYKSFRTRRQLADCAVLVEQRWWKLLDFATLRRSSVSFFKIDKTESVLSKWARAKSRAAKVGKGLSKDAKARKLALQHWLEAIDPRHRYGHNLHFYYDCWLHCESKQPFFYWLDIGEGKEVSLDDKCARSKLQQQCIKYLGPKEREVYEVVVEEGKLMYKMGGKILDTTEDSKASKWIFVLSTSKNLYVGQKKKGIFQHSSFLAGGATSAAGRLEAAEGILKAIWPHSGHYRPTEENFEGFLTFLKEKNVDLTDVKKSPLEEDEEEIGIVHRATRSEVDLSKAVEEAEKQASNAFNGGLNTVNSIKRSRSFEVSSPSARGKSEADKKAAKKMTDDSEESEEDESEEVHRNSADSNPGDNGAKETSSISEGFLKPNLFVEGMEGEEETMPNDLLLRRMNFKRGKLSFQLGKQLDCKWTTGAGPRIGCVGDCPSKLRLLALEQVHLSPRSGSGGASRVWSSSGNTPSPIRRAGESSLLTKPAEVLHMEA